MERDKERERVLGCDATSKDAGERNFVPSLLQENPMREKRDGALESGCFEWSLYKHKLMISLNHALIYFVTGFRYFIF